jgi:hypothetical protein
LKLIVSLDAEADNQWDHGRPLTTENVRFWQPFQRLCEKYGIPPTYLITSEIAADPRAIQFLHPLVEAGKAEVGAHLHPWTTPPYLDRPGLGFNDDLHLFPSELPKDLLRAKCVYLTEQIEAAIGKRPTSFRAGRFGFDQEHAEILAELGYLVDSSVTPLISWSNTPGLTRKGGPDFSDKPAYPFEIQTRNSHKLFEIPITILITNKFLQKHLGWLRAYQWLQGKQNGRFIRLNWLPAQPVWLRPLPDTSLRRLCKGWSTADAMKMPAAVMMFHSSELMPGGSPYRLTEETVQRLLFLLEEFFKFAQKNRGEGMTLTEVSKMIAQNPHLKAQSS